MTTCRTCVIVPHRPQFLLRAFGWAADSVAAMARAEPHLAIDLLNIGRARMHLIAFALAHSDNLITDHPAVLVRAPIAEVAKKIMGLKQRGLRRILRRLPNVVLPRDAYRQLARHLADREAASILYHCDKIDGETIALLTGVPAGLRRVAMARADGYFHRMDRFTEGLNLLVSRGTAPTFEALVAELKAAKKPGQFAAKLNAIVERLSLPQNTPPPYVDNGRRLDHPAEIRRLAKRWRNCLDMYIDRVNDGRVAIYLWQDPAAPALCAIERAGRFGWVVDEVKGPLNAEITPDRLAFIHQAFAKIGIQQAETVNALRTIIEIDMNED